MQDGREEPVCGDIKANTSGIDEAEGRGRFGVDS
jgi:hypothetical protein